MSCFSVVPTRTSAITTARRPSRYRMCKTDPGGCSCVLLTLNLESSSEGKEGVLALRTAAKGGIMSGLVCSEFEGMVGVV